MIDTVIWVYEEDPGVLFEIASDDDSGFDPLYSRVVNMPVTPGWTYYIEVLEFEYPFSFLGNYALDVVFHP